MANETVETAGSGATKRALIIGAAIVAVGLSIAFHTAWRGWLCESAWLHSSLVDGPTLILAVIAWRELGHSQEANEHRRQMSVDLSGMKIELGKQTAEASKANEYRHRMTELEELNFGLREKLTSSTQQIADNLKRPPTKAEKNAATLRKYMRKMASVTVEGQANAAIPYEIVDVNEDNILTLFSTPGANAVGAYYNLVDCEQLTVNEMPHGSCPVRINVIKYQGQAVSLGQCGKWEDREGAAAAAPSIEKAPGAAWSSSYAKQGSPETRTLGIFQARDGNNRFQLESSQGLVSSETMCKFPSTPCLLTLNTLLRTSRGACRERVRHREDSGSSFASCLLTSCGLHFVTS